MHLGRVGAWLGDLQALSPDGLGPRPMSLSFVKKALSE